MSLFRFIKSGQFRVYGLGIIFYFVLSSILIVPAIQHREAQRKVAAQLTNYINKSKINTVKNTVIVGEPTSIEIPRLNISLPVTKGYYNYNTKKWTLDSKHVFTNTLSNPDPQISTNQTNTLMIYGHDIPGVLVTTSQLVYGDILKINTSNGYQFTYYYDKDKKVVPIDKSILTEKNVGDPIMLVTCTGTYYQFRHVMYFKLIEEHKNPISTGLSS